VMDRAGFGRRGRQGSSLRRVHGPMCGPSPLASCLAIAFTMAGMTACDRTVAAQSGVAQQVQLVGEYVEAFNSGRPETLAAVLERLYAPAFLAAFGGAQAAAWDRLELFRTYGPVELHDVDTMATPAIIWTRGRVSRGWVGHQFHLAETGERQVTRHSVWRARPMPYPRVSLTPAEVADSMRQYLDELSATGLFSGSVVMSQHGSRALGGSWGSDGQVAEAPVTPGTRFHTASVTKLFTATALLQLVEAGRVGLGDPIGRWIPEYPVPYRDSVRVRHLLTHTSGIELDDATNYLAAIRTARTAADLLQAQTRHIADRPAPFPPGSEYDYTSEGIDLAGVIIERATRRAWTDIVHDRVLVPAGMQRTRFAVPREEGEWALGRTSLSPDLQNTIPGSLRPALEVLPVVARPSAGIWSTAEDLHCFMRSLLEHRLLGAAWTDSLLTPQLQTGALPKYGIDGWVGLGAQGEDLWGTRTVGHGGVVPGYSAAIEYVPHNGWLLTVVSSTGEATAFLVFQRFLELVAHAVP
jgi:CubicO group peptidase (beta-lactamase class C family)